MPTLCRLLCLTGLACTIKNSGSIAEDRLPELRQFPELSKQSWLFRPLARDFFQFWILDSQRFRHFYLGLFQHADQLQRIHHALGLIVIIRNHEYVFRGFGNACRSHGPRPQLLLRVQIVVPLKTRHHCLVVEPCVIAASVQSHITNRSRYLSRRLDRSSNHWLVNIAESHAALAQHFKNFQRIPSRMPHLHHQRIVREPPQHSFQICRRFVRAVKRERELQEHRAQLTRFAQNVKSSAHLFFITIARARIMREFLPHLRCEHEIPVLGNAFHPKLRVVRLNRIVKTCIDFNRVKKFRQVRCLVKSLRLSRRIRVARPIRIRPAGRAHSNIRAPRRSRRALALPTSFRSTRLFSSSAHHPQTMCPYAEVSTQSSRIASITISTSGLCSGRLLSPFFLCL